MIFPDVSIKTWLNKYPNLERVSTTCTDCGKRLFADMPFISSGYIGLISPKCKCGSVRSGCESKTTRIVDEYESWSAVVTC